MSHGPREMGSGDTPRPVEGFRMEFAEILEQTIALLQHLAHDENGRILVWAGQSAPHATPLVDRGLATEARDLTERGLADVIIISGDYTGAPTSPEDIAIVRQHTILPILIGSGAT